MAFTDLAHRMGHAGLKEAAEKGMRAMARLKTMTLGAKETFAQGVQSLEVNAAAFSFGFARGYFAEPGKDLSVLGIPLDLAAGFGGHVLGVIGGLGKYKEDAHNLADGALASYSTTLGLKLGVEQRDKKPAAASPSAAAGMSVQELVNRAAAAV
jgi:hypothetical protein